MVIVAFGAFGITFESKEYQWVLPVALFGTVIKEFFILVIIVGVEREEQVSAFKNHAADFLFVVFYSLAYTVVIGNILKPDDYNNYILVAHYSIPLMIMKTVLVVFIFLMLYLPLRIPYFLYEGYTDAKMKALSLLSIVLVAAGAVLPVFDGETSLKKALQYPERVEILFLNSSGIKTVPEEIKKFRNLKALHLGSNSIQNVPDWIVQFEKLEWINLGANSIAEFPEHLLDLPNVKKIELYYNKIKKMPGDLSGFKKLQYLNLRTNMMLPPEKARVAELLRKSEKNPSGILLDL
jgi:Leucine-rich repeat (LRR) protein